MARKYKVFGYIFQGYWEDIGMRSRSQSRAPRGLVLEVVATLRAPLSTRTPHWGRGRDHTEWQARQFGRPELFNLIQYEQAGEPEVKIYQHGVGRSQTDPPSNVQSADDRFDRRN
jgi:hypothetical protein